MTTISQSAARVSAERGQLEALCVELRDHLAGVKRSVDAEIRTYPTPIPRCDAQFNHLYDERSRLQRFLVRINAVVGGGASARELVDALAEFAAAPAFSEHRDEQRLRERARLAAQS